MDFKARDSGANVAARDCRCGSDRRVQTVFIDHPERRVQERRNTRLQAFLWSSGQLGLRA
jgi:hypothetical protein